MFVHIKDSIRLENALFQAKDLDLKVIIVLQYCSARIDLRLNEFNQEEQQAMTSGNATASIGSTLTLDPIPDPNGPMDERLPPVRVTIAPGGGSWPHRHEVRYADENERFRHVRGNMLVFLRTPGSTWRTEGLDPVQTTLDIPPGDEHCIVNVNSHHPAEFFAETIRAHLIGNEFGGNVHRTPREEVPPQIERRIAAGLIK